MRSKTVRALAAIAVALAAFTVPAAAAQAATGFSGATDPLAVAERQGLVGPSTAGAKEAATARDTASKALSADGTVGVAVRPVALAANAPGTSVSTQDGVTVHRAPRNSYGVLTGTGREGLEAGYIVINDASAPSRYSFTVGDAETHLALNPDGTVAVFDESGTQVNYIAAPWARDATGKKLPTRYAVSGNTITQTVEHLGAVYPVTADPETGCGFGWCSLYLNRSETNNIANFPSTASAIVTGACAFAGGPVAFACGVATAHVVDMAGNAARQNRCVGLVVYGVPPFVTWNAFIHGDVHCHW